MFRAGRIVLVGLSLAFGAAPARAYDCDSANASTVELNACLDREYLAADKALNGVYAKVLASIAGGTEPKPYDPKSHEAAMRSSQRAWIAFRDADCKEAIPMEWSGGTGTSAAVLGCLLSKVETRIHELKTRYNLE